MEFDNNATDLTDRAEDNNSVGASDLASQLECIEEGRALRPSPSNQSRMTDEDEEMINLEEDNDDFYLGVLVSSAALLQNVRSLLVDTPSAIKALSSNRGPCDLCDEDHPTLRCHLFGEDDVSPALRIRLDNLMEKLERQRELLLLQQGGGITTPQSKLGTKNEWWGENKSPGLQQEGGAYIDGEQIQGGSQFRKSYEPSNEWEHTGQVHGKEESFGESDVTNTFEVKDEESIANLRDCQEQFEPVFSASSLDSDDDKDLLVRDPLLHASLLDLLLDDPREISALSLGKGPCRVCHCDEHPTLRCTYLLNVGIPANIHDRLEQLKLQMQQPPPKDAVNSLMVGSESRSRRDEELHYLGDTMDGGGVSSSLAEGQADEECSNVGEETLETGMKVPTPLQRRIDADTSNKGLEPKRSDFHTPRSEGALRGTADNHAGQVDADTHSDGNSSSVDSVKGRGVDDQLG